MIGNRDRSNEIKKLQWDLSIGGQARQTLIVITFIKIGLGHASKNGW